MSAPITTATVMMGIPALGALTRYVHGGRYRLRRSTVRHCRSPVGEKVLVIQECIPGGCVPSAAVSVGGGCPSATGLLANICQKKWPDFDAI